MGGGSGGGGEGRGGGCTLDVHGWPSSYDHRSSHSYMAGTEHVRFSPTRVILFAPSAKRRDVSGESLEG